MIAELLATIAAVPLCVYLLEGVTAVDMQYAVMVGVCLAAVNLILRAPLHFLTKPLGCLTLGIFGTVVDAVLVELCAYLADQYLLPGGFAVASFPWAIGVALCVNILRGVARLLFGHHHER